MKLLNITFCIILFYTAKSQDKAILDLNDLIDDALRSNLELNSLSNKIKATETFYAQENYYETPELNFRLMEVPGLKLSEAMFANIELMQIISFPTKTKTKRKIASIDAVVQNQIYNEQVVQIIMDIKTAYYQLWMTQKNIELNKHRKILIGQIIDIVKEKYKTGIASQQDMLKTQFEFKKAEIQELELMEAEETSIAKIASLLNKDIKDIKGIAVIPDNIVFDISYEQLVSYALRFRSKLKKDSLNVEKLKLYNNLAKTEYFPDLKIGIEYVSSPLTGFRGWSFTTGISLPFSFWTINKTNARVKEEEFNFHSAKAIYYNERNKLISKVREYYVKLTSLKQQLELYHKNILPILEQSLHLTLIDYQTNRTDLQSYLDFYIMYIQEKKGAIMKRYEFEKTLAELEKEIGCRDIKEVLNF